jgi:alkylmercury lyase
MSRLSLDAIVQRLSEQLQCEQEDLCRSILHQVSGGKPLSKASLATSLHISQNELEYRLARVLDTEFDQEGNILGWGVTLMPTRHRFQLDGKVLFTWCAFDTVLFPPTLGQTAQVSSTCPSTEQSITFVATPKGVVRDLVPAHSVMSLIIPANSQGCVRATFCEQSLFFATAQAASRYLAAHPGAVLLSIEEAATVGKRVAASRFVRKNDFP